jgi:hypothetical protein
MKTTPDAQQTKTPIETFPYDTPEDNIKFTNFLDNITK